MLLSIYPVETADARPIPDQCDLSCRVVARREAPDFARRRVEVRDLSAAAVFNRTRGLSIGQRLTLIVLVVAVPMLLLTAGIGWRLAERERDLSRQAISYSSRLISNVVDAQLGKYIVVAQALAASPMLQRDEVDGFRHEAERALSGLSGAWVVLTDAHGRQVLNTSVPAGQSLSPSGPDVLADQARAFQTRQFQVSDVGFGSAKIPRIQMGVPVFRGGSPAYYLAVGADVGVFPDFLNSQRIPEGWLVGMIDRRGNVVARSRDHERWVAKPASAGWRAVMHQDGVSEFQSLEGRWIVNANAVSPFSGWATGVAVERMVIEAPIRNTIVFGALAGLAVTLSTILLAGLVARRITAPIRTLERTADALRHHQPVTCTATGVPEFDHVVEAFDVASKALIANEMALRASEQRLRLLLDGAVDYAVFMLDIDGRIITWNEGARRIKGYDADDVIGRHFEMFYGSKDLAANELQLVLRGGVVEKECEHVRKDGTRFVANAVTTPLFDEKGNHKGYTRIVRDVTGQRRDDEALRTEAALLDLSRDAIVYRGANDEITYWSLGAERTYGWLSQEAKGQVSHDLLKTRFPGPLSEIRAELEATGQWDGKLVHSKKDGLEVVVASRWVLQRDRLGNSVGVLEINRNMT